MNPERELICAMFQEIIGEDGCGVSCSASDFYKEDGEWKMFLSGFMAPWPMGKTLDEVEANLRQYAAMGFGLH